MNRTLLVCVVGPIWESDSTKVRLPLSCIKASQMKTIGKTIVLVLRIKP